MSELTACQRLDIIRHKGRPTAKDYIPLIFDDFFEMHGDRLFGDDGAVMGGIAYFKGIPVTVIAEVKGRDLAENQKCNFGMPHPEGYRKALRLARQAEKFHRPVICLVDTAGAFCGVEAEKRGQGEAIAKNIMEFMTLKTPVISIILGEGGSGGALALAVCDELAMLENAIYSVILILEPAMQWKSIISYIKTVEPGTSISYGGTFTAKEKMTVATIPVGYADGMKRDLSGKGRVLIHGQYAPILGRICMDQFMVDAT